MSAAATFSGRLAAAGVIGTKVAELSLRQIAILDAAISSAETRTIKAISAGLSLNKPSVTRGVDRLESLGFVKRRTLAEDRRMVSVEPTEEGRAFRKRVLSAIGAAS